MYFHFTLGFCGFINFMGFVLSFLKILRKTVYFVAIFPITAVFPLYIPKILRMVAQKVTHLLKVTIYRVDISEISPFGSTCQSYLFIVTHMSCDQKCPFMKFPKSSFFGLTVNHSISRNSVSHDQRVKMVKFCLFLA